MRAHKTRSVGCCIAGSIARVDPGANWITNGYLLDITAAVNEATPINIVCASHYGEIWKCVEQIPGTWIQSFRAFVAGVLRC